MQIIVEAGKDLTDGVYSAEFNDGITYRVEKINGDWFYTDGTGWKEEMLGFEIVTSLTYIGNLPAI